MKWTFPREYCHPTTKAEVRHRRATKHLAHRNERHQPFDLDGIVPMNVMVKGEVKDKPRVRAIVVNVAPNVFDIVYR